MRVADCFPPFDVDVEAVAVFGFYTEYPVQQRGKLFERHLTVVDAAHLIDAVDKFHKVYGVARPLKRRSGIVGWRFG